MKKRILGAIVIGDHVQALGIIRSLGRRKIPVYLLHDENLCIGRFSCYTKKFMKIPDINKEKAFVDFMVNLAMHEDVKDWILFPTNDAVVYAISKNKKILEEYYKVPTPSFDVINLAYNKEMTYSIANKYNILHPKTICPKNKDELIREIPNITFPVIIKPAIMHHFYEKTKMKVIKVASKEELINQYIKVSSIIDSSEIMIQEIIPGGPENLYSFCSFFKNQELLGIFLGKRSRQRPMDFGKASTLVESKYVPEIVEPSIRLLKAMNYYGLSEIEFKRDPRDNQFKLLEMNPRTWLWHSLAIRCGVDFPYLLYNDNLGEKFKPALSFRENVKFLHFYTDLEVVVKEILIGNMSIIDYLRSLEGEKEFAVFSLNDPLPFIYETIMLPYLWFTR